jgi:hypothetical protein
MPSLVRQKYWRLVHLGAWERSKKNFQWALPLAFGAVAFLLNAAATGFAEAKKSVVSKLLASGTSVLFAVGGYAYNLFRRLRISTLNR